MSAPSLKDVLDALQREGRIDSARTAEAGNALAENAVPWYVRAMVGFGAWIAALFFLGFFASLTQSRSAALFFGGVLLIGAVGVRRLDRGDFLNQLALAASLAGQLLIVFGTGLHSATAVALLVLALQVSLILFYADPIHRFISTLVAVGSVEVVLLHQHWFFAAGLLASVLALAVIQLWLKETMFVGRKHDVMIRPIAYGLVIAMLGLLLPSISPSVFMADNLIAQALQQRAWNTALLGAGLLYLVHALLTENDLRGFGTFAWSSYAAVVLLMWPALRAPGLIGALIVLLLGFRRGNPLLLGMALLFLALFLSAYYYHLALSLLLKSIVLASSGAVLLLLRWVLIHQLPPAGDGHAR